MTYRGVVKNGVIVLNDGVILPEGTVVEVTLVPDEPVISSPTASLSNFLMSIAGTIDGLPEDMAKNHDH